VAVASAALCSTSGRATSPPGTKGKQGFKDAGEAVMAWQRCSKCGILFQQARSDGDCPGCGKDEPLTPSLLRWYWACGKEKRGPYSLAELQRLTELKPTDMLLPEGAQKWEPASSVKRLLPPALPCGLTSNRKNEWFGTVKRALAKKRPDWILGVLLGIVFVVMAIFYTARERNTIPTTSTTMFGSSGTAQQQQPIPAQQRSAKVTTYDRFVAEFVRIDHLMTNSEFQTHVRRMESLWREYQGIPFDPATKVTEVKELLKVFEAQIDGQFRGSWYAIVSSDARDMYLFLQLK
jgi:hypothetical protein